jgi:hypothetical protein
MRSNWPLALRQRLARSYPFDHLIQLTSGVTDG